MRAFILSSYSLDSLLNKVSYGGQAIWRADTFWMVLESIDRELLVLKTHDNLIVYRTSGNFKVCG